MVVKAQWKTEKVYPFGEYWQWPATVSRTMFKLPRTSVSRSGGLSSLGSQPVVANSVVCPLVVLFAIAFHDHSVGQAGEVDNEPSEDYPPAKMTF